MKTTMTIEQIIEAKKLLGWPDDRVAEYLSEITGGSIVSRTLLIPDKTTDVGVKIAA